MSFDPSSGCFRIFLIRTVITERNPIKLFHMLDSEPYLKMDVNNLEVPSPKRGAKNMPTFGNVMSTYKLYDYRVAVAYTVYLRKETSH